MVEQNDSVFTLAVFKKPCYVAAPGTMPIYTIVNQYSNVPTIDKKQGSLAFIKGRNNLIAGMM